MKKIKNFVLAFAAICLTAGLASCSKDEKIVEKPVEVIVEKTDTVKVEVPVEVPQDNNWSRYQAIVTEDVKAQKKHDKVILLVAFGSTWEQAFNAFDATVDAYKARFTDYDVFLSYSSAICINRAAAGENTEPRNYYAPPFWLNAFADSKVEYDEIVVQSLQVIPGEEFTRVINYIKDFANNSLGDIDDKYLSEVTIKLGLPLLAEESDVMDVAKTLDNLYKEKATEGAVAFMGHGNPDSYDTYKANVRYNELETELQKLSPNYFVGTVDAPDNYKVQVLERMQEAGITEGKVYLHPLMSIAGDHAHNDMGGDDGEDMDPAEYEYNDEGEIEDLSWKCYFAQNGYTCGESELIMKGLLEVEPIRNIWIQHTKAAETLEDYYHSMYPED